MDPNAQQTLQLIPRHRSLQDISMDHTRCEARIKELEDKFKQVREEHRAQTKAANKERERLLREYTAAEEAAKFIQMDDHPSL